MSDQFDQPVVMSGDRNTALYGSKRNALEFNRLRSNLRAILATEVSVISLPRPPSIWVRDFLPIRVDDKLISFKAATDYMDADEAKRVTLFQDALKSKILAVLDIKPQKSFEFSFLQEGASFTDLVLDGGNLVVGPGYAVVTKKAFRDNPRKSKSEINRILRSLLNDRKVIFIDPESGDPTGHADGMVAPLGNVLLVNDLHKTEPSKWHSNLRLLEKAGVDLIPLPYEPSDLVVDGWPTMTGNYINFICTPRQIILPTYGKVEIEQQVAEIISHADPLHRQLHFIDTIALNDFGGGLHCITWN